MTKMPLERQKMPKTHLTPKKGLIYPRNIKNYQNTPKTSKSMKYLQKTRKMTKAPPCMKRVENP